MYGLTHIVVPMRVPVVPPAVARPTAVRRPPAADCLPSVRLGLMGNAPGVPWSNYMRQVAPDNYPRLHAVCHRRPPTQCQCVEMQVQNTIVSDILGSFGALQTIF